MVLWGPWFWPYDKPLSIGAFLRPVKTGWGSSAALLQGFDAPLKAGPLDPAVVFGGCILILVVVQKPTIHLMSEPTQVDFYRVATELVRDLWLFAGRSSYATELYGCKMERVMWRNGFLGPMAFGGSWGGYMHGDIRLFSSFGHLSHSKRS